MYKKFKIIFNVKRKVHYLLAVLPKRRACYMLHCYNVTWIQTTKTRK